LLHLKVRNLNTGFFSEDKDCQAEYKKDSSCGGHRKLDRLTKRESVVKEYTQDCLGQHICFVGKK
jgi:hypothetical protein